MKVGLAALSVSVMGFFSACTGPAGPAGENGLDGKDGSTKCASCHGENAKDVQFKFSQFETAKHNTGVIYEEEAGRLQCGGCHTASGFIEATSLGKDDPVSQATGKLSCKTCHTIHNSFDSTDFKLRVTSGFALRQGGAQVDFKKGNICAKCHQARAYAHNPGGDTLKASGTSTYSRFGPHYGVVANVVAMSGLEDMGVTESNPHGNLSCTDCHMGSNPSNPAAGGHTFKMPVADLAAAKTANPANCACHGSAAEINKKGGYVTDVTKLLADTKTKLLELGMLDLSQTTGAEGYNVLGEYPAATKEGKVYPAGDTKLKALVNYLFLAKDRSNGVHNPKYMKAMLQKGLEELNK
jgi:hypothetical protein